ncbi:MAG: hypothetical protein Fur0010_19320 [Bdellovibrio sp.]
MKTLKHLINSKSIEGLRLRYVDWNCRICYFTVESVENDLVYGTLDSGEIMTFSIETDFWSPYHNGDENWARAI